jgi:alpha-tubulin suppressor-like RCC1 family protein
MSDSQKTGEIFIATMKAQSQFVPVKELDGKTVVSICGGPKKLYVVYTEPDEKRLKIMPLHWSVFDELDHTTSHFTMTPNVNATGGPLSPRPLATTEDIVRIRQHGSLNVVLDSHGEVSTFGFGNYGALGQGVTVMADVPQKISKLSKKDIVEIACGDSHGLALSKCGDLYAWGRGFEGQLGTDHVKCLPFPGLIAFFDRLGYYDSSLPGNEKTGKKKFESSLTKLNTTTKLKGQKENQADSDANMSNLRENQFSKQSEKTKSGQAVDERVQISPRPQAENIVERNEVTGDIANQKEKRRQSLADPFAIENALINHVNKVSKPVLVKIVVTKIFAAENHSLAITNINSLYAWGENFSGQLGISEKSKIWVPELISLPEKVGHLSTCNTHTTLLTTDGNIYSAGLNCFSQTGIGSLNVYKTFQKLLRDVDGDPLPKFKLVETSFMFSVAVSEGNNIYYWGRCFLNSTPQTYPKAYTFQKFPEIGSIFVNQNNILLLKEGNGLTKMGSPENRAPNQLESGQSKLISGGRPLP